MRFYEGISKSKDTLYARESKSFGEQVGNTGVNLEPSAFSSRSFGISTLILVGVGRVQNGCAHSESHQMRSVLRRTFSSCKRSATSGYSQRNCFCLITKWCHHFSEGRTDVHDEQRTSVISDALLQRTEEAIRAKRRLKLKELHQILPEVSMTTLYEVVIVMLGYRKLCARWVPKMLTEEHKKKRMGFALDFLTRYAEAGNEFP
ncbi:uncharacterized protein TNIN_299271 [Trichonephila inaurata madagascariensis]|uniref:Uncharacterized protein n=1 Tax=Trichonephila inaurata madagascariensis TaxID=2747483 RepID=A0A8X6XFY1_9ARAC|nr:uncharacterized protein TNIN_299271 [Trichonephila inaurata madagascariensis]